MLVFTDNLEMLNKMSESLNLRVPIVNLIKSIGKNCSFNSFNDKKYDILQLIFYFR